MRSFLGASSVLVAHTIISICLTQAFNSWGRRTYAPIYPNAISSPSKTWGRRSYAPIQPNQTPSPSPKKSTVFFFPAISYITPSVAPFQYVPKYRSPSPSPSPTPSSSTVPSRILAGSNDVTAIDHSLHPTVKNVLNPTYGTTGKGWKGKSVKGKSTKSVILTISPSPSDTLPPKAKSKSKKGHVLTASPSPSVRMSYSKAKSKSAKIAYSKKATISPSPSVTISYSKTKSKSAKIASSKTASSSKASETPADPADAKSASPPVPNKLVDWAQHFAAQGVAGMGLLAVGVLLLAVIGRTFRRRGVRVGRAELVSAEGSPCCPGRGLAAGGGWEGRVLALSVEADQGQGRLLTPPSARYGMQEAGNGDHWRDLAKPKSFVAAPFL